MVHIGNRWDELLAGEFASDYYQRLRVFLKKEYSTRRIYPHMNDIFNALRYTDYDDVRAVILGQDPYHGPGQAHGLCFSVPGRGSQAAVAGQYFQGAAGRRRLSAARKR